jgi:hypothetical protein
VLGQGLRFHLARVGAVVEPGAADRCRPRGEKARDGPGDGRVAEGGRRVEHAGDVENFDEDLAGLGVGGTN